MTQAWYAIEPKAPLVFRSGKPFGTGSRDGANFPWPSSLAGLLRTQVMDAHGLAPWRDDAHKQRLLALSAVGPLLAQRDRDGRILDVWVPKPADAVLLLDEATDQLHYHRLAPCAYADGAGSDLPAGLAPANFGEAVKGKPQPGPAWWPLRDLLRWARGDDDVDPLSIAAHCEQQPWQVARRTHVAIDRDTFAAEGGRLFQTEGLDFDPGLRLQDGRPDGWPGTEWVLLAQGPQGIAPGLVTFGGERRLSWLAPLPVEAVRQPDGWAATLSDGFALTLTSPALFAGGWRPGWLDASLAGEVPGIPGLRVRLRAAALDRWQGISGWDLAAWKPRATRKAVAAGATYWFEVLASGPQQLAQLWLAPISDLAQDRRDGFGVALPRPWNATLIGEHNA